MSKYVIIGIIVIGIIIVWLMMGNLGIGETVNGDWTENYIEVIVPSSTGYPTIRYYHQHNKVIVISPIIQSRYMESEFLRWYNNGQINGIQYSSVLQQSNDLNYLPYP